jgi:hypothetical protein
MATEILVQADDGRVARLSGPDEDGDYGWSCRACWANEGDFGYQQLTDTIENATVHLEDQCRGEGG